MSYSYQRKGAQEEQKIPTSAANSAQDGPAPWWRSESNRWLYRFLFIWLLLVYLWGMLHLLFDVATWKCWYNFNVSGNCVPLELFLSNFRPLQAIEFTLLILAYGALLKASLNRTIPLRWHWLSFLLQGTLVFIISLVIRQDNIVLSLYLVLILEAVEIVPKARFAVLIAGPSLLLFVLNEFFSRGILRGWGTALLSIWSSTDYAALSLFLIGYLILYGQLSSTHHQLAMTHIELSTSTKQIEELTRLTERQRLARELHDTLSQGLLGLKLQLEAVDALLIRHAPTQAHKIVQQAMSYVQTTIIEARGAIDDLRSSGATTSDCVHAAQELIERFVTATGIPCISHLDALQSLAPMYHEHVLRIIGEGLMNIARHAQATQVWINALREDGLFWIEVRDNGVGFDPATVILHDGHYGLLGLRERARMVGGRIDIQSTPGSGTRIRCSLAYSEEKTK